MKRWIALSLVLLLVVSLWGCKKEEKASDPAPNTAPTQPAPTDPTDPLVQYPDFYLLTKISGTLLNEIDYVDVDIQLFYDSAYQLLRTDHFMGSALNTSVNYRSNTLELLSKQIYGDDGQVMESYVHDYDDAGNLLSITGVNNAGEVIYSQIHGYTADGYPDYYETYYSGVLGYWESYHYDENGYRDSYSSGDGQGNLYIDLRYRNVVEDGKLKAIIALQDGEYYHTIAYNDDGNPVTEVYYEPKYKVIKTIQYTYTESGKPLLESHTDGDGKEYYRVEYAYDGLDQLSQIRIFHDGQLEQNEEFTYHEGRLLSRKCYTYGQLDAEYTYTYELVLIPEQQAAILSDLYAELMNN